MILRALYLLVATMVFAGCATTANVPAQKPASLQTTVTIPPAANVLPADPASVEPRPQAQTQTDPNDISKMSPEEVLDILEATVLTLVRTKYVRINDVNGIRMRYGALKGVVASLNDPHSEFLPPDEAARFRADMEGKFFGIGASLDLKDGRVIVARTTPGSPAEKAGIKQGDIIAAIDDKPTFDEPLDQTVSRIRGNEGVPVKLTVIREGAKKVLEISVIRGNVVTHQESLTWKLHRGQNGKTIMVITVPHFDAAAMLLFREAVAESAKNKVDGVVLDLRNNPGGLLTAAHEMSCTWLDAQKHAVVIEHRGGKETRLMCPGSGTLNGMPTVVLINKYSASASEIVAGALQDYSAARVIGETSFGKGSVQAIMTFPDGSMLRLTIDLWKTPQGKQINKLGVTPDEKVKPDDAARGKRRDAQLKRAIDSLTLSK